MSTPAERRQEAVQPHELDAWVRAVYEADPDTYDLSGGVAAAVVLEQLGAECDRDRTTVRRHLEADPRVVSTIGIGPEETGPRTSFLPSEDAYRPLGDDA